jgi:hypothetical protein
MKKSVEIQRFSAVAAMHTEPMRIGSKVTSILDKLGKCFPGGGFVELPFLYASNRIGWNRFGLY